MLVLSFQSTIKYKIFIYSIRILQFLWTVCPCLRLNFTINFLLRVLILRGPTLLTRPMRSYWRSWCTSTVLWLAVWSIVDPSADTARESLPAAPTTPGWTTPSPWLAMVVRAALTTGSSRIAGAPIGVRTATSGCSVASTCAVSARRLPWWPVAGAMVQQLLRPRLPPPRQRRPARISSNSAESWPNGASATTLRKSATNPAKGAEKWWDVMAYFQNYDKEIS